MSNESIDKSSDTITTILYVTVFLGVMLLAVAITLGALSTANNTYQNIDTTTQSVIEGGWANKSGYTLSTAGLSGFSNLVVTSLSNGSSPLSATEIGFLNSSGYTLISSTEYGFKTPVIVSIKNVTTTIAPGNYTLTGNVLKNATSATWLNATIVYTWTNVIGLGNITYTSGGLVRNATGNTFNDLIIGYTYNRDSTNATTTNTAITDVKDNTLLMVSNFFALMPTVGTILAVVVLIAGIVILVLYVSKMRNSRETEGYTG